MSPAKFPGLVVVTGVPWPDSQYEVGTYTQKKVWLHVASIVATAGPRID